MRELGPRPTASRWPGRGCDPTAGRSTRPVSRSTTDSSTSCSPRHRAVADALPLGPPAGARGRGRVDQSGHRAPLRGLRPVRLRRARRPGGHLDDSQRALLLLPPRVLRGHHAPGRQEGVAGLVSAHHLLLGHGLVVDELRRERRRHPAGAQPQLHVPDPFDPCPTCPTTTARGCWRPSSRAGSTTAGPPPTPSASRARWRTWPPPRPPEPAPPPRVAAVRGLHRARHDDDGWRWKLDPSMRFGGFGPWRPEWSMLRMPGLGDALPRRAGPRRGGDELGHPARGRRALPAARGPVRGPAPTPATSCTSNRPDLVAGLVLDLIGTP